MTDNRIGRAHRRCAFREVDFTVVLAARPVIVTGETSNRRGDRP